MPDISIISLWIDFTINIVVISNNTIVVNRPMKTTEILNTMTIQIFKIRVNDDSCRRVGNFFRATDEECIGDLRKNCEFNNALNLANEIIFLVEEFCTSIVKFELYRK